MPNSGRLRVAYLTGQYAWAGDTFIRREVHALRQRGVEVDTFSIRRPPAASVTSDDALQEFQRTTYILARNPVVFLLALLYWMLAAPVRLLRALRCALNVRSPGLKAWLWHLAYLAEAAWLARQLRARGITHLHNHIAEGSATVAMLAAELSGVPFSFTVHGPYELDKPQAIGLPLKIQRARFVVAITQFAQSQLFRWSAPADWAKIHVIRCGLDEDLLALPPAAAPSGPPRVVCVGRLCPEKGQVLLVEAVARLAGEGIDLEVAFIGDGPSRGDLEQRIRTHHLEDKVHLLGWKPNAECLAAVRAARGLVLPSFAEGLPVVLMEALALGRPVIATRIAGIPELVQDNVNGWLVTPASIDELVAALKKMLAASPAQILAMGQAGGEVVRQRHAAAREAARLQQLFTGAAPAEAAVSRAVSSDTRATCSTCP